MRIGGTLIEVLLDKRRTRCSVDLSTLEEPRRSLRTIMVLRLEHGLARSLALQIVERLR